METNQFIYKKETYNIIGAAMEVHKTLGMGFLESVYQEAMEVELAKRSIPFVSQKRIQIQYKDVLLNQYYIADLFCYDKIIVELKAVSTILPEHEAQIINYIHATGIKLGMLLNFGEESLYFKRFPNITPKPICTNPQL
ncbi:MAG: GxxExxY protein [Bacteroidales bacterium]|nr:GxxExxY protein [Bacteroidales bacterium]